MTVMSYTSSETETDVVGTSWGDVASVTIDVADNLSDLPLDHMIWITCEYSGINVDEGVAVRITIDGTEVGFDHFMPSVSGAYRTFTNLGLKHCDTELTYQLKIQARCMDATQTVTARRKRLLVMQH